MFSFKHLGLSYLPHLLSSTLSSLSLPSGWRSSGELLILLFSTLVSLAFTSLYTTSQPLLLLLLFSLQASPCVLKMSSTLGVGELLGLKNCNWAFFWFFNNCKDIPTREGLEQRQFGREGVVIFSKFHNH